MAPLFSTPTGHKLLMAGAFFMFLGYLGCKKIVNIKT
jgi:Flp pilus assembly protein TadB